VHIVWTNAASRSSGSKPAYIILVRLINGLMERGIHRAALWYGFKTSGLSIQVKITKNVKQRKAWMYICFLEEEAVFTTF